MLRESKLTEAQREMCSIISAGSSEILALVEDALSVGLTGDAQGLGFTVWVGVSFPCTVPSLKLAGGVSLVSFACARGPPPSPQVTPAKANLRADFIDRAWRAALLQRRFADKVARIQTELRTDESVPKYAMIDAGRAGQVLTNLVGNAIKFERDGGRVTCSVDVVACRATEASGAGGSEEEEGPKRLLRVRVADTGRGMTPEGIARLFRPWSQVCDVEVRARVLLSCAACRGALTPAPPSSPQAEGAETKRRFGGHGLGLVISREIARSMVRTLPRHSPLSC